MQGGREDLVKSEVNVTNTKRANSSNELLCMLLLRNKPSESINKKDSSSFESELGLCQKNHITSKEILEVFFSKKSILQAKDV